MTREEFDLRIQSGAGTIDPMNDDMHYPNKIRISWNAMDPELADYIREHFIVGHYKKTHVSPDDDFVRFCFIYNKARSVGSQNSFHESRVKESGFGKQAPDYLPGVRFNQDPNRVEDAFYRVGTKPNETDSISCCCEILINDLLTNGSYIFTPRVNSQQGSQLYSYTIFNLAAHTATEGMHKTQDRGLLVQGYKMGKQNLVDYYFNEMQPNYNYETTFNFYYSVCLDLREYFEPDHPQSGYKETPIFNRVLSLQVNTQEPGIANLI